MTVTCSFKSRVIIIGCDYISLVQIQKMFKNPKWITFDILGLCNQLLTSHHNAQRAIQLFIDRRANTILIDRIRSLTGNIQPRVDDPRSNVRFNLKIIFISKIAYFSYDDHLFSAVDHGSRS